MGKKAAEFLETSELEEWQGSGVPWVFLLPPIFPGQGAASETPSPVPPKSQAKKPQEKPFPPSQRTGKKVAYQQKPF